MNHRDYGVLTIFRETDPMSSARALDATATAFVQAGCHCSRAHKPHQQVAEEVTAENHVNHVNEVCVVVITNNHHYNNSKIFQNEFILIKTLK